MRLAIRRTLERNGYEVLEACHGKEALKHLDSTAVDLVVTDIIMPESEGLELTMTLHKSHPKLPVVAITGGGHGGAELYLALARSAGAADTLSKPFDMEELLKHIRVLLPAPESPTG